MCFGGSKPPPPKPTPTPPPPPARMAAVVQPAPGAKKRQTSGKRKGQSQLIVRRPAVAAYQSGAGVNLPS